MPPLAARAPQKLKKLKSTWLRAWMACRCVYHPEMCVRVCVCEVEDRFKISIDVLMREVGSCECESKNNAGAQVRRSFPGWSNAMLLLEIRGLIKAQQSGHVSALIHISIFPQPRRWHVNLGRTPAARCSIWQQVPLRINIGRNSRGEIHTLEKQLSPEVKGFFFLKWKSSQGKQEVRPSQVSDCELQMSVDN